MRRVYQPPPPVDPGVELRDPAGAVLQAFRRDPKTLPNLLRTEPGSYLYYQGRCLSALIRRDFLDENSSSLPHKFWGDQTVLDVDLPVCVACGARQEQACGAGTG